MWMRAIGVVAFLLAGCNTPQASYDPFLGRTTVPPPATIQPGQAGMQPYYPGSPPTVVPGPVPSTTTPMSPPGSPPPPGAYGYPQGSTPPGIPPGQAPYAMNQPAVANRAPLPSSPRPVGPPSTSAPVASPVAAVAPVATVAAESPIRISEQAAPVEPRRLSPTEPVHDLADLPAVGTGGPPVETGAPVVGTGAELPAAANGGQYGHAPDHAWLRGQLEYLENGSQWKIRYIPIEGETDEYGGSVVISNSAVLERFRSGDFVEVHGAFDRVTTDAASQSPAYRIDRVAPIAL